MRSCMRFWCGDAEVRLMARAYGGCSGAEERYLWNGMPLVHDSYGRPCIEGDRECSLSYSAGFAAFAMSTRPVGVDIEVLRSLEIWNLWSCFTERERVLLQGAATKQERLRMALVMWTRKEAVLKLLGCGLRIRPECVDVSRTYVDVRPALCVMGCDGSMSALVDEALGYEVEVNSCHIVVEGEAPSTGYDFREGVSVILMSLACYCVGGPGGG